MKVLCINNSEVEYALSKDGWYEAEEQDRRYKVTSDLGNIGFFMKSRFITEKELHNKNFNNIVDEEFK